MKVQSIHIYPIKSLGGISLESCELTNRGLKMDRRYMLVDENYKFLTQREIPEMALFSLKLDGQKMVVKYAEDSMTIDQDETGDWFSKRVKVWSSTIKAKHLNSNIDQWFSDRLGIKCYLAYMPDESKRTVNPFTIKDEIVSFADGYPYLIANEQSLQQLNYKLEESVEMNRFRANIVVSGNEPFEEDNWIDVSIGTQIFTIVKKCSRCPVVNTNQRDATSTPHVLKMLSSFRKQNNKVYFGANACWKNKDSKENRIRVGEKVIIISKKTNPK